MQHPVAAVDSVAYCYRTINISFVCDSLPLRDGPNYCSLNFYLMSVESRENSHCNLLHLLEAVHEVCHPKKREWRSLKIDYDRWRGIFN